VLFGDDVLQLECEESKGLGIKAIFTVSIGALQHSAP